jgi:3-oxoacyl-[acyl-carrier protein] reductase
VDLGLTGKRAWVTGASSGLGRATAAALLGEGAKVAISARPGEKLDTAARELGELGEVRAFALDTTEHDRIPDVAAEAWTWLGGLDIAISNGGGPPPSTPTTLGLPGLDAAYGLLLRPAYSIFEQAVARMGTAGGVIGFITSVTVAEPIQGLAASNIMRAGVTALAKAAATELGPRGIRVLCFAPGRIATDRITSLDSSTAERTGRPVDDVRRASETSIPLGRYGEADEFGRTVAFCCSTACSYLTGTTVWIDGGSSHGLLA